MCCTIVILHSRAQYSIQTIHLNCYGPTQLLCSPVLPPLPWISDSPYQTYLNYTANSILWPVLAFCLSLVDTSPSSSRTATDSAIALDSLFLHRDHGAPPPAQPKKKDAQGVDHAGNSCHGTGTDFLSLCTTDIPKYRRLSKETMQIWSSRFSFVEHARHLPW